jgi:hypothetical protein
VTTGRWEDIMRDFVQRMLHPDKIPSEALQDGMAPETAWAHWCENRPLSGRGRNSRTRSYRARSNGGSAGSTGGGNRSSGLAWADMSPSTTGANAWP